MARHVVAMMVGLLLGRSGPGGSGRRPLGSTSPDDAAGTFWDWVELELERARRYEHELALLRMPLACDEPDVRVCASVLRTTDQWCVVEGDLFVLAPETGPEGADGLARRLRASDALALGPATAVCFPGGALTRHGMEAALGVASPRWVRFPDISAARAS